MNMNISCRIANANTQCGRITNPPERKLLDCYNAKSTFDFINGGNEIVF